MALSRATVIGRLAPPPGLDWERALDSRSWVALTLLDFVLIAARALAVPPNRVRAHQKPDAADMDKATRTPGHWHCDAYPPPAHVIAVVGERPTEFLLGTYPDEDRGAHRGLSHLEATLERWQPEVGAIVLIDRLTIHRRPVLGSGRRIFLLGELIPEG